MSDEITDATNEAFPIDDEGFKKHIIREEIIIERQWDRVNSAASLNPLESSNRAAWKSSVMALEDYLWNILESNDEYLEMRKQILSKESKNIQDEIEKTHQLVKQIKKAMTGSQYAKPKRIIAEMEDDNEE
jgi:hypothetical protein